MRNGACSSLLLLLLVNACSPDGPVSPSPPSSLTVTLGASSILTGSTTLATATALYAAGASSAGAFTWTSDRPNVATVSPSGVVTGVSPGSANVVASYQGLSASALVNVALNVTGSWKGTAQLKSCDGFGDSRTCGRMVPPGTVAYVTIILTQDGNAVRGSVDLQTVPTLGPPAYPAQYVGELTGMVDSDGVLSLEGPTKWVPLPETIVDMAEIRHWSTRVVDGAQTGTFSQAFPTPLYSPPFTGIVQWTGLTLRK